MERKQQQSLYRRLAVKKLSFLFAKCGWGGVFCAVVISGLTISSAFPFNPLVHDQVTRSAINYLGQTQVFPTTGEWLSGPEQEALVELLVRSAVDEDYKPNLFLDTPYHQPLMGVKLKRVIAMFSGLYHTINVTRPGEYWDYDGYSYRASSRQGNDAYLLIPGLRVRGDLSWNLNGASSEYPVHGINPGPSTLWFQGTGKDWDWLYLWRSARKTVFPPADVMATVAFQAFYRAERATRSSVETWTADLPFAKGLFKNVIVSRYYARSEIEKMPRGLDLLGSVFHLAQDQAIPHHALGTSDFCHAQLEDEVERLACDVNELDGTRYLYGEFGGARPECQRLYDPALVEFFRKQWDWMDPRASISVSERMRSLARVSAEWWWGRGSNRKSVGTEFPSGEYFSARSCSDLVRVQAVHDEIKNRYNLAVAMTASLFEYAAYQYELGHPRPGASAESLLHWFQLGQY